MALEESHTKNSYMPERNEAVKQSTLLTDLPNEIIGKIFEQVSFAALFNLEQVNKQLREVVLKVACPKKNALNHKTITKIDEPFCICDHKNSKKCVVRINTKYITAVFSRTNIKHINLSDNSRYSFSSEWDRILDSEIFPFFEMVPQLLTLDLSDTELMDDDLFEIAKHCPLLEELSLANLSDDIEIENGLKQIFINCRNIKYLDVSGSNLNLNGKSFAYIPSQLKYLNISGDKINTNAMNFLVSKAKNLETLIFVCSCGFDGWFNKLLKLKYLFIPFMPENLIDFLYLKELEMLSICFEDNETINVETLKTLNQCQKLKALEICFDEPLYINVFEILKDCKNLQYLYFEFCSNYTHLIEFVQNCQLKYLSIAYCKFTSPNVIYSLLTECNSLAHLEFTHMLSFNYEALAQALKEECPQRRNVLKLVIYTDQFILPQCKWCEIIEIDIDDPRVFSHFTDVEIQYSNQKNKD